MKRALELPEIIELSSDDESVQELRNLAFQPALVHGVNNLATTTITEDACLAKALSIFPDISHDYVRQLYESVKQNQSGPNVAEHVINEILEGQIYPKQRSVKRRKISEPGDRWGEGDGILRDKSYYHAARKILQIDFPNVPSRYVREILKQKASLFSAYSSLDTTENTYDTATPAPYERLRKARNGAASLLPIDPAYLSGSNGPNLERELQAAREQRKRGEESRLRDKKLAEMEAENEQMHAINGGLVECQCCYADVPLNRTISCTATDLHFFCFTCIKTHAETQIGLMKYELRCFDTSGCSADFSKQEMNKVLGEATVAKLETLQQQDEVEQAGLEGLQECPFCEFKAVCPPIEEYREFQCQNPTCEKVSCRLCNLEGHAPVTCDEARKDKNIPVRHQIEEAMSEALIRTCPKCKVKIVKEEGCNKMVCVKCHSSMCYVCKKDITREGYKHFSEASGGCPVHDVARADRRHFEEVQSAQKKAIEEALKTNPDLTQEDIEVDAPKNRKSDPLPRRPPQHPIIAQADLHPFGPIGENPFNVFGDGLLVHPPNLPAYHIPYVRNNGWNPVRPAGMQPAPPLPPQGPRRGQDPIERLLSWTEGMQNERLDQFAALGRQQHAVETNLLQFPNGHNYPRDNYYPYHHLPMPQDHRHHLPTYNRPSNNGQHRLVTMAEQHGHGPNRIENMPGTVPLVPETRMYAQNDVGFADLGFPNTAALDLVSLRASVANPAFGFGAAPPTVPPALAPISFDFDALNLATRHVQPQFNNAALGFDDRFPLAYP